MKKYISHPRIFKFEISKVARMVFEKEQNDKQNPIISLDQTQESADPRVRGAAAMGTALNDLDRFSKIDATELESAPNLKKDLSEDEAVKIYDEMIDPTRKAIDMFREFEVDYDANSVPLGKAYIAAGGDPKLTRTSGEKAKPSNVLHEGFETEHGATANLKYIYEQLNDVNNKDHIAALMKLSRSAFWDKFTTGLTTLNQRRTAAEKAFEKARKEE